MTQAAPLPCDHMVEAGDGLKLHVRTWTPDGSGDRIVACLPGLTRTLEDFVPLARHLSARGWRVIAISARGRGLSDRDPDPARYQINTEADDALRALDALGVAKASFVGTSRGGLLAMMIGLMRRAIVKAVVLNDIGPDIDLAGLRRLRDDLHDQSVPRDWADAAARLARRHAERFPALDRDDFDRWARRAWREVDGRLEKVSDPAFARLLDGVDLDNPMEPLWPLFDALREKPVMVVRGALSDILSADQLAALVARRPDLAVHVVEGQGHAPLLDDAPAMNAIADFLEKAGG